MKCPDCGAKITTKNYDAEYEWYECPKCEGAFTVDEMEASRAQQTRNEKGSSNGKAGRGRGKERKDARGAHKGVQTQNGKPIAKGKKRRTEIEEDEQAVAQWEQEVLEPKVKHQERHHRDELDTAQVIGIWQDEIQDIYDDLGLSIDEDNARDKALIIWREIHIQGVAARDQEVPHALCKDHE